MERYPSVCSTVCMYIVQYVYVGEENFLEETCIRTKVVMGGWMEGWMEGGRDGE